MTQQRTWNGRAFLGMSLDGFIAGPGGDLAFLESEPGKGRHTATGVEHPALVWETFFPQIDALLMGRVTYEKVLSFGDWPFPGVSAWVLSSTLRDDQPNARVVRSLPEASDALAEAGASQVYIDGGNTVSAALAAGLLDELTVSILPIVIGQGIPLFGSDVRAELAVRGAHVTEDGLARITYDVIRAE